MSTALPSRYLRLLGLTALLALALGTGSAAQRGRGRGKADPSARPAVPGDFPEHRQDRDAARATPKGVRVIETSADPYVALLIQAHAEVVDGFIANGHAEMMKNHPVPERPVP